MKTIKTRIFSCLLAVMLAIPAFSMSALAAGTDPEAAESIPTTGGIEFDPSATAGGWDEADLDAIRDSLNEKVEEGMINISMNTSPVFFFVCYRHITV